MLTSFFCTVVLLRFHRKTKMGFQGASTVKQRGITSMWHRMATGMLPLADAFRARGKDRPSIRSGTETACFRSKA